MSAGAVRLEVDGPIATITLERPDKLNALAGDMRGQLYDAIARTAEHQQVAGLILTGAGRGFCAGGDVDTMIALRGAEDHAGFHRILHQGADCVLALQAFPGITLAAINGIAAGAGLALALNCDLRVGSDTARLAASWSGIGLAPDWAATFWLPRMLGYSRALRMVLAGESIDASQALELGLLDEKVPAAGLAARAHAILAQLTRFPETARQAKRLLRNGLSGSIEASLAGETEAQADLFAGPDVAEALAAFVARRKARNASGAG